MKKLTLILLVLLCGITGLFAQPVLKPANSINEYSIIYELYGGTNASDNKENYQENATVTLAEPTRDGYYFGGWYWDEGLLNPVEGNTFSNKKGALKVYAKWITLLDLSTFAAENMVEIIPADNKVTLEDFAGTKGPQDIFAYSIGKYEVKQELYQAVTGTNPSYHKGENLPVERVSWYDAVFFCNELTKITMGEENCCYTITDIWKNSNGAIESATVNWDQNKKGFRLPTEAEWELAARGGVNGGWDFTYSGSNNIGDVAWYYENSHDDFCNKTTHPVGTKKPNLAGLYDMSGNVFEWCWDVSPYYSDGRYYRGGGYNDYGCDVDGGHSSYYASYRNRDLGFRIVCSASN